MRFMIPLFTAALMAASPPTTTTVALGADAPTVVEVRMIDAGGGQWRFEPSSVEAHTGDIVRFIQDDIAPHNVQFQDVPAGTQLGAAIMGPFLLQKGETYDIAIDDRFTPGAHTYVCTPHEPLGMVGQITVVAEDRR